jgi:hypothetical protein
MNLSSIEKWIALWVIIAVSSGSEEERLRHIVEIAVKAAKS